MTQNGQAVAGASIVVAKYEDGKARLIKHNVVSNENGEYWRLLNDGIYLVYAYSPDGSNSEPIEIEVENKPYTDAIQVNIELDSAGQDETENKQFLNVTYYFKKSIFECIFLKIFLFLDLKKNVVRES